MLTVNPVSGALAPGLRAARIDAAHRARHTGTRRCVIRLPSLVRTAAPDWCDPATGAVCRPPICRRRGGTGRRTARHRRRGALRRDHGRDPQRRRHRDPRRARRPTLAGLDSDGDGLSNTWETTYGLYGPFSAARTTVRRRCRWRRPDNAQELDRRHAPARLGHALFAEGATGPSSGRASISRPRRCRPRGRDDPRRVPDRRRRAVVPPIGRARHGPPRRGPGDARPASQRDSFSTVVESDTRSPSIAR